MRSAIENDVSDEFILISEARARLQMRRFGNMRRTPQVVKVSEFYKERVAFLPQIEAAGRSIRNAIVEGKLKVYAFVGVASKPVCIGRNILETIIPVASGVPDRAPNFPWQSLLRQGNQAMEIDAVRFGELRLQASEFEQWLECEYHKQRFGSQIAAGNVPKVAVGRPRKITPETREYIILLVQQKQWIRPNGLERLSQLLVAGGHAKLDRGTLTKFVDELHAALGVQGLGRKITRKRGRPSVAVDKLDQQIDSVVAAQKWNESESISALRCALTARFGEVGWSDYHLSRAKERRQRLSR